MSLVFTPENHKYTSLDLFDDTKWFSASKIPSFFKRAFDPIKSSEKASKNKNSKWYKIPPEQIRQYWLNENLRSTTLGTWYHEKEEAKLNGLDFVEYKGRVLKIFRSDWKEGVKYAPNQKLQDGVYPELLVYLQSAGVCGQFDKPIVCDGYVDLEDHKSNKKLKEPAFVNWEGITEKFLAPLMHLEATKLEEYSLQLSIGMYIILRHNPQLKPGVMTLNHVTFEIDHEDEFGYPVHKLDENNEPILKGVEPIVVPYRKREVELMFEWLKKTRNV